MLYEICNLTKSYSAGTSFSSQTGLVHRRKSARIVVTPASQPNENQQILRGIDLELAAGQAIAIVGPSGSGKSTLLNILGTLDRPTGGSLKFNGRDLLQLNEKELAFIRNREIGFVFQQHHLLAQCTVLENVLLPTLAGTSRLKPLQARTRATRLLERVGLQAKLDSLPGHLSGGERQRVAVVRAMINRPLVLLADEPTGSLDTVTSSRLAALLAELNREEQTTLILVTHDLQLAGGLDRVYRLELGLLIEQGAKL